MRAYERLLKYVEFGTSSSETSGTHPSTRSQFLLAHYLKEELIGLGLSRVEVDDNCYLYAEIPASVGYEEKPGLGFIAHVDTSPDFCGEGIRPRIIDNYRGGDIVLGTSGRTISQKVFPHLDRLVGKTLIVTDGTTLLGADDKAGVAEIVTMAERVLTSDRPHGKICISFTPDEEIGEGASLFDVNRFGATYAYTVDGGEEGAIDFENFNAAAATVVCHGFNIHPGDAKDKMINASLLAMDFDRRLPLGETPRDTEKYEGFFHLTDMEGNVEKATLYYIIRDHDAERFEHRKNIMTEMAETMNQIWGEGTVEVKIRDQYRNMADIIRRHFHLVRAAESAARKAGVEPVVTPIRGGTDGATLSYMGLPCPNLGTGGHAFHGPYEHIAVESMDTVVDILTDLAYSFS